MSYTGCSTGPAAPAGAAANADVVGSAYRSELRVAESDTDDRSRRSLRPLEFLAFEADPFAVMVLPRAESGRHHGHAAGRTDRRTVVSIHATSIHDYSRLSRKARGDMTGIEPASSSKSASPVTRVARAEPAAAIR